MVSKGGGGGGRRLSGGGVGTRSVQGFSLISFAICSNLKVGSLHIK